MLEHPGRQDGNNMAWPVDQRRATHAFSYRLPDSPIPTSKALIRSKSGVENWYRLPINTLRCHESYRFPERQNSCRDDSKRCICCVYSHKGQILSRRKPHLCHTITLPTSSDSVDRSWPIHDVATCHYHSTRRYKTPPPSHNAIRH